VRQALSAAIDKQVLFDLAYYGLAQPATGPITTVTGWAYNADAVSPRYNVEYANELLDAAGYPRGTDGNRFTLRLTYIATFPQDVTDAEIIKEQMKDVGIEIEMIPLEYNTFKENVYVDWNFDLAIKDLAAAPDPSISVARVYITSNIKKKAFTNCNGYSNSTVDDLWDQIEKEMDREKRAQLLYEVQEILVYECPEIWLVEKEGVVAYNDEFEGLIGGTWWMGSEPNDDIYWILGEDPPETPLITTEVAILIAVIAFVIIGIVAYWLFRRR
jgi:peptide/nickel transport system substrate-binding protein